MQVSWFSFFLPYRLTLGNGNLLSVLNPLFISSNGFPWLLTIQPMQHDSDSLGREQEWGGGTRIIPLSPLPYRNSKHTSIFDTGVTPRIVFFGCYKTTHMHNSCCLLPRSWFCFAAGEIFIIPTRIYIVI